MQPTTLALEATGDGGDTTTVGGATMEPPANCTLRNQYSQVQILAGDCREILPGLPLQSFDAIISDPPYPGAIKAYTSYSETDWLDLMYQVVRESRRLLKPQGSAVFILQPNSERVGQLRPWLWEFVAWCCREWNVVQDVYWWNFTAPPTVHSRRTVGLLRPSLKLCVWLGPPDCYRNQEAVLLDESASTRAKRLHSRFRVGRDGQGVRETRPSRQSFNDAKALGLPAERGGGATPFNVLPIPNSNSVSSGGALGHAAATPAQLVEWWCRYIVPLPLPLLTPSPMTTSAPTGGGAATSPESILAAASTPLSPPLILDPFAGAGTLLEVARRLGGLRAVGIERDPRYIALMQTRFQQ